MLRSWARRWNQFAPENDRIADETLSELTTQVVLVQARVATTTVDLQPRKLIGFTGRISLEALHPDRWTEQARCAFAALTMYSRYCGTGVRTIQGMGLTLPG